MTLPGSISPFDPLLLYYGEFSMQVNLILQPELLFLIRYAVKCSSFNNVLFLFLFFEIYIKMP